MVHDCYSDFSLGKERKKSLMIPLGSNNFCSNQPTCKHVYCSPTTIKARSPQSWWNWRYNLFYLRDFQQLIKHGRAITTRRVGWPLSWMDISDLDVWVDGRVTFWYNQRECNIIVVTAFNPKTFMQLFWSRIFQIAPVQSQQVRYDGLSCGGVLLEGSLVPGVGHQACYALVDHHPGPDQQHAGVAEP